MMKSILCYGDSNTWGMVPMTSLDSGTRHAPADRWPRVVQEQLGSPFTVIDEGQNGRTTVFDDPIDGPHKNGRTYLLPCLESHAPLDLVIIMLGTNDLKSRFGISPYDVAAGAGQLVKMISPEVRGQNGIKPDVLLVCPAHIGPLDLFTDAFAGAPEKSRQLHTHYRNMAELLGCHYLNAADHVRSSAIDGVHFEAPEQHALGSAIAQRVQSIFA
jgi:lysophospholipase L1-like esterase